MNKRIRVMILEDHQSIVDGYLYRLATAPQIEVVGTISFGEDLEPALKKRATDVLLLDVNVPTSPKNPNPYPIHHAIPKLLGQYPDLSILVISMHAERGIIRAVMENGASGYILKDDHQTIKDLGNVILSISNGGIFLSEKAHAAYLKNRDAVYEEPLTARQMEVLSICAAYPDNKTADIAVKMKVANSTVRNLLSETYFRLGVRTRAAALAKARQMGIIASEIPPPEK